MRSMRYGYVSNIPGRPGESQEIAPHYHHLSMEALPEDSCADVNPARKLARRTKIKAEGLLLPPIAFAFLNQSLGTPTPEENWGRSRL
jgi:hypothetical protein